MLPEGGRAVPSTIVKRIREHVLNRPGDLAVAAPDGNLTYAELWARAGAWAEALRPHGSGPVAVVLPRCRDLVSAQLGAWMSGRAYVPVDPTLPVHRRRVILREARVSCAVVDDHSALAYPDVSTLSARDAVVAGRDQPEPSTGDDAVIVYTSGSTGTPKGVVLTHLGLDRYVGWYGAHYAVVPGERAGAFASLGFDVAISDLWGPLGHGLSVYLPNDEDARDPERVINFLGDHAIQHVFFSTPMGELIIQGDRALPQSLRCLVVGGARLRTWPPSDLPCAVHNIYGPSEATIAATATSDLRTHPGRAAKGLPPVGFALPGVILTLKGDDGCIVPDGSSGELVIGGDSVARGYYGDPDLTDKAFSLDDGVWSYQTGDILRRLKSGEYEFVGRRDRQVKVRGYRVELGEVERSLMDCPGVELAHVFSTEGELGADLIAWVQGPVHEAEVSRHLVEHLPQYMQPRHVVRGPLPLSANGKVDEKELVRRWQERSNATVPASAPECRRLAPASHDVEGVVAAIWAEFLGISPDLDADFFRLGGDSIRATRVTRGVRERFGISIPITTLFQSPRFGDYLRRIEEFRAQDDPGPGPAASDGGINMARPSEADAPSATAPLRTSGAVSHNPSFLQLNRLKRIGARASQGHPATPMWIPLALQVLGERDDAEIRQALESLSMRHEALRSSFYRPGDGNGDWLLRVADRCAMPIDVVAGQRTRDVDSVVAALTASAADIEAPLARAAIMRISSREAIAVIVVEHLVADGESMGVLATDFAKLLTGGADDSVPLQQSDWIARQRERLEGARSEELLSFWRSILPGERPFPVLDLPGPVLALEGARIAISLVALNGRETENFEAHARDLGATPYVLILDGLAQALLQAGLPEPFVVHTPVANRGEEGSEDTVGWLAHSVPIPVPIRHATTTLDDRIRRLRDRVNEVLAHQDLPLPRLVQLLSPLEHGRAVRPARLFLDYRVVTPFISRGVVTVREVDMTPAETTADPGLSLIARRTEAGLTLQLIHDPREVSSDFVDRVAEGLRRVLTQRDFVKNPS